MQSLLSLALLLQGASAAWVAAPALPAGRAAVRSAAPPPVMQWGASSQSARDRDYERRQDRLASRKAAAPPKGQVTVTFPQKGGKTVTCKQGEPLGKVISRAGVRVKFDCKNGRCGTCQVRLNGRAAFKICQGATVPGGATKKLSITLDNP